MGGMLGFGCGRPLWLSADVTASFGGRSSVSRLSSRRSGCVWMACAAGSRRSLVVGLNKYSHDAGVCIVDADTGQILVAAAKERISRVKHDGGGIGQVLAVCCEEIGAEMDDIALVVSNNHHFRVAPFERRLNAFGLPMGLYDQEGYGDAWNLLPGIKKIELSHHLAHAWSVAPFCPGADIDNLDDTLVVVMDGMGESLREMHQSKDDPTYFSDLGWFPDDTTWPKSIKHEPWAGYREAETVYRLDKEGRVAHGLWKRWTKENSPPELYNHGFQDMESCGAVYSRAASAIFNNWNHCGKVMGLAPWAGHWDKQDLLESRIIDGHLSDGSMTINWPLFDQVGIAESWENEDDKSKFSALANTVQVDLETVTLRFLSFLQESFKAKNLCFCGGVALNSTLNGRIAREAGFEKFMVTPFPGDEGIAIGCALFGVDLLRQTEPPKFHLSPYLGRGYNRDDLDAAVEYLGSWVEFHETDTAVNDAAALLIEGKILGWFFGRSEVGPRALGNRSIIADPRSNTLKDFINSKIKNREGFRPLAPVVLEEHVDTFFDRDQLTSSVGFGAGVSPFMSITANLRADKAALVPAVAHVDGTARLQTLKRSDNPEFYSLIETFDSMGGLPMVLNTSFNIAGEPIVDTPLEALESLLDSNLDAVVFKGGIVTKRKPLADTALVDHWVGPRSSLTRLDRSSQGDGRILRIVAHDEMRSIPLTEEQASAYETIAIAGEVLVSDLCQQSDDVAKEDLLSLVRWLHGKRLVELYSS